MPAPVQALDGTAYEGGALSCVLEKGDTIKKFVTQIFVCLAVAGK